MSLTCTCCAQDDVLVVRYLRDVSAVLHLRSLATGTLLQAVRLPGLGSVEVSGRRVSPILHFSYNSLTEPGAIYTCVLRPAWACPGRLGTLDTSGRAHCAGAGLCAAAAPGTASMQRAAQRDGSCSRKSSPVDVGPAMLLESPDGQLSTSAVSAISSASGACARRRATAGAAPLLSACGTRRARAGWTLRA